uniref:Uncharacterized protein n=1 Tax=Arundo donax TaxID=35708 RepID=A0A0A9F501_ARUDO
MAINNGILAEIRFPDGKYRTKSFQSCSFCFKIRVKKRMNG